MFVSVIWTPCFDDFTCANLIVPLDYDDVSAGETTIAFIQQASNLTDAQDILINPGGPGASGVGTLLAAAQLFRPYLGQKHNIISFDPRGVNNSGLRLDCLPDAPAVAQYYDSQILQPVDPESDASISEAYTLADGFGQLCSNAHRDDEAGYANSVAVAGDIVAFRKAAGAEYVGGRCTIYSSPCTIL
ncbi:hypothetical protein INS49_002323 [Diaporthe citri]|uniref:uncharacterized protein n=1 Tax=Diaporthe citri TaxID=83186 RepID=UPI001C7EEE44|nr:uncharacterized protein INS49_002323 [Diaporthe citri]KAG6368122.1 hypothetical protein INS49_002323 [Diaporthe citri]